MLLRQDDLMVNTGRVAQPMHSFNLNPNRPPSLSLRVGTAIVLIALTASRAWSQPAAPPERKLLDGITTRRLVPGAPYELAGKRVVFANWYYIQPGDLDWRDNGGKSVYV